MGTLAMPGTRSELALIDAAPAGFTLTRNTGEDCELLLIAVDPDRGGQGIGTELLRRSTEFAKHSGIRRMFLEVRSGNTGALRLYERRGFVCVGQRKDYYVGENHLRFDAITMALSF
ncbi:ribosomal-protein-alanine N-acetyltransferase [Sphingosinicella soli]|uniref:Ribosomal-protein-alanine N-acetyltransferase n=1 Tax=Sphingosinicella soli TaxID=333708 RepID=A0A7W7F665_9SPHN|nr:ribosomal-protein-alanine N-acetyltransferase [Sphingosinicella soli]